ncbi:MAG: hypothetical protein OJI74_06840, partial [Rhodanobacter thiooxydans]|nr:hypothetical protein [Rhodanobacter thiooxydans]
MVRLFFQDVAPFVLRQRPPRSRFADRNQRGAARLDAGQWRLQCKQLLLFRPGDLARIFHTVVPGRSLVMMN